MTGRGLEVWAIEGSALAEGEGVSLKGVDEGSGFGCSGVG